jgi:hypothetical protein
LVYCLHTWVCLTASYWPTFSQYFFLFNKGHCHAESTCACQLICLRCVVGDGGRPEHPGRLCHLDFDICQETLALTKSGANVTDVKRVGAAQFQESLVQVNFANQKFTYKGTKVFGDNTIIQGKAGILAKQTVDNQAVPKPYFADDVKLILNGKTYSLVYGAVDGTSAASFIFQRLEGKCAVKGIALRQN